MTKTASERIAWWSSLSSDWKKAYNEAMLGNGPIEDAPSDKDIAGLFQCPNFRFAGPRAFHANMSFELTDLSGLMKMEQAEMVSVTFHHITKLDHLKSLRNLSALFLNNNELISLDGLETLTELKILVLSANQLTSLVPLGTLEKLENLQVPYNALSSFDGLIASNTEKLVQFVGLPNRVSQKEIDRLQNDCRVRVLKS